MWGLVPAMCAGVVTAYASANGFVSAWVGVAPTVMIACIATGLSARSPVARSVGRKGVWLGAASVVVVITAGLVFQWVAAYSEAPMRQLTARVQSGPYRGLLTTPERRAFVQGLSADIGAVARPSDRIQVLGLSPAGYLLSPVPPAGASVWLTERPRTRRSQTASGRRPPGTADRGMRSAE